MKRELSITSGPIAGAFVDLYIYSADKALVRVNCDDGFQLRGVNYSSIAVDLMKTNGKWETKERNISRKLKDGKDLTYEQKRRMCGYLLDAVEKCLSNPEDIKQARIESLTADIEKEQGIIGTNLDLMRAAQKRLEAAADELLQLTGIKTVHRCTGRSYVAENSDMACLMLTDNPDGLCVEHSKGHYMAFKDGSKA